MTQNITRYLCDSWASCSMYDHTYRNQVKRDKCMHAVNVHVVIIVICSVPATPWKVLHVAYCIWRLFDGCVVQMLVQGSEDCQDNWSMSELMHAIVLLAHFHSLASFVFGCGVTSETDHPDGHVYTAATDEHDDVGHAENDAAVNGHTAVTAEVVYYTYCSLYIGFRCAQTLSLPCAFGTIGTNLTVFCGTL